MPRTLPLIAILFASIACSPRGPIRVPIAFSGEQSAPHTPSAPQTEVSGARNPQAFASSRIPSADPTGQPAGGSATTADRDVTAALGTINQLLDAYFDFNAYQLRPDAVESVSQAASILKAHMAADTAIRLIVEGHCDERGSAEFNLALGDRRAESVRDLLSQLGIAANRMTTISYGEVRPECGEATEACWQKNRRAHIRHER